MRVTDKVLREQIRELQVNGIRVDLEFAYGQVKVVEPCEKGGHRDITHYMSNKEASLWLDAFMRGYFHCLSTPERIAERLMGEGRG